MEFHDAMTAGPTASGDTPGSPRSEAILRPEDLGGRDYRRDNGLRLAYVAGAMVKGIASEALVARMAASGMLAFFGTGGLGLDRIAAAIDTLRRELPPDAPYGMNLLCNTARPETEDETVLLFLRKGIRRIEASAFMSITRSLVHFRLKGARRRPDGTAEAVNRIQAKVSRPEVARHFLSPAPAKLVRRLVEEGVLSDAEASLAPEIPMASEICLEADSGGHTDNGNPFCLFPVIRGLRDEVLRTFRGRAAVHLGMAGGIGTPDAVAAAFLMGADFVLTGSINQCTVEAGISDTAKGLLAQAGIQDTEMAPAGDMFELGAKVRVLRKGTLFPARANRLYEIYRAYDSLEAISPEVRKNLEEKYFGMGLEEVRRETRAYLGRKNAGELERMDGNPKLEMARVFQWYFAFSGRAAILGTKGQTENFQIHCGPALGAFNALVKGTPLEEWKNRHADRIGEMLMGWACDLLNRRLGEMRGIAEERRT